MLIKINNLSKSYGDLVALDNLSIDFSEGVYGLLGANGAGKTTFINLLTDNIARDSGEILIDGTDISHLGIRYRRLIGYMPQQQGLYDQMTALAFMHYVAELKEIRKKDARKQIDELLGVTNLSKAKTVRIAEFSGGMKQRLLLAQSLLGDPKILFLDEPTAGLDPKERIRIRNYISSVSNGKIIFLATHIVSDIDLIANQVLILKGGRIVQFGKPHELSSPLVGKVREYEIIVTESSDPASLCIRLQKQYKVSNFFVGKNSLHVRLVGNNLPTGGKDVPSNNISLEDVYLYYLSDE